MVTTATPLAPLSIVTYCAMRLAAGWVSATVSSLPASSGRLCGRRYIPGGWARLSRRCARRPHTSVVLDPTAMAPSAAAFDQVTALDAKLKGLCGARRGLDDPEVEATRERLCEECTALLLSDYPFATVRCGEGPKTGGGRHILLLPHVGADATSACRLAFPLRVLWAQPANRARMWSPCCGGAPSTAS